MAFESRDWEKVIIALIFAAIIYFFFRALLTISVLSIITGIVWGIVLIKTGHSHNWWVPIVLIIVGVLIAINIY